MLNKLEKLLVVYIGHIGCCSRGSDFESANGINLKCLLPQKSLQLNPCIINTNLVFLPPDCKFPKDRAWVLLDLLSLASSKCLAYYRLPLGVDSRNEGLLSSGILFLNNSFIDV